MTNQIQHDPEAEKFFITLDGDEAILEYHLDGNVMDFYHTYVPNSVRGKGIAEKIVTAGFEYARAKNLKVMPSCPYISATFLKRYPQYQSLVV